jgi:hypothetical protein
LPFNYGIGELPQYDPFNQDIKLKQLLEAPLKADRTAFSNRAVITPSVRVST